MSLKKINKEITLKNRLATLKTVIVKREGKKKRKTASDNDNDEGSVITL